MLAWIYDLELEYTISSDTIGMVSGDQAMCEPRMNLEYGLLSDCLALPPPSNWNGVMLNQAKVRPATTYLVLWQSENFAIDFAIHNAPTGWRSVVFEL